jgi:flagellar basal body-associated protein FliL
LQGKTLYTILLSIIAVLTLALAVLVIFIFTAFNTGKTDTTVKANANSSAERVVPPEEQAELKLYSAESDDKNGDSVFNIKSTQEHPNSFLMASVSIIYDAGEKNKLLESRKSLLEKTYLSELKQATIEYFRNQSFEDLQASDAMQKARDSLKDIYSGIISSNKDLNIIIKIVFDKWIIQ